MTTLRMIRDDRFRHFDSGKSGGNGDSGGNSNINSCEKTEYTVHSIKYDNDNFTNDKG